MQAVSGKVCSVEGCGSGAEVKKMCQKHYVADWHQRNRGRRLKRNAEWYLKNREKHLERSRNLSPEAKARKSQRQKERRQADPLGYRNLNLKSRYGITQADYERMLVEQGGCCAVCKSNTSRSSYTEKFAVDHCHKTGKVRSLLCHPCNWTLGYAEDKPEILESAAQYLKRHNVSN